MAEKKQNTVIEEETSNNISQRQTKYENMKGNDIMSNVTKHQNIRVRVLLIYAISLELFHCQGQIND